MLDHSLRISPAWVDCMTKVVLTLKLADWLDGIDVSVQHVGDVLDLPDRQASLLIAENWAIPDRRHSHGPPPLRERRRSCEFSSASPISNSTGYVLLPSYRGQRHRASKRTNTMSLQRRAGSTNLIDVLDHVIGKGVIVGGTQGGLVTNLDVTTDARRQRRRCTQADAIRTLGSARVTAGARHPEQVTVACRSFGQ
jgi:hypothetical protein